MLMPCKTIVHLCDAITALRAAVATSNGKDEGYLTESESAAWRAIRAVSFSEDPLGKDEPRSKGSIAPIAAPRTAPIAAPRTAVTQLDHEAHLREVEVRKAAIRAINKELETLP